ncbi:unnamed protein product [Cercopithifilaria johnstoni]|uniref:ATP synthase F(0) complex subunit e, mitochondrial n=1 Tax=Cercopithifilaria johnstoni TaxID=2874296 RepID=A0A8J2Q141_9BILA|nr:unnamed protein product [Cercopithifilaria johnstoni]
MDSKQDPTKIVLPPAIRVSPLLRFMRYSFLGLGVVWGFFRYRMICEKHAAVRQKEHDEKLEKAEKERILRKQQADKSLYDIYLNILETDLDEGGSLFGSVRE